MKKFFFAISVLFIASCAHKPKCGNPEGAKLIMVDDRSCQVRIRQVTVGTDLKIPDSLKGPGLANFSLEWIEPELKSGQIALGHFVLVPMSKMSEGKK